jgi:tetratricopeptide (TPR) repeat protein
MREFRQTRQRAQANLDRREYSKLLGLLEKEDLAAERPFALLRACELAVAQGKWSAAIEHAGEIERLAPRGSLRRRALALRARALAHGRGKADEALKAYLSLAKENPPGAAPLLLEAADLMVALDKKEEARQALEALEQLRPELIPYLTDRHAMFEKLGSPVPALEAKTTDGTAFSLADLAGKTVVLVFWAAWDEAGLELLEGLEERAERSRGKLVVQGICLDPPDEPRFAGWLSRSHGGGSAPIVAAKGFAGPIARAFGVDSVPATRLIDAEGNLAGVDLDGGALGSGALRLAVDRLVR